MTWQTPEEYSEAVQTPSASFVDPQLCHGNPRLSRLGLPKVITGAFASVYRFNCGNRDFAVRCFLRNLADQGHRYRQLTNFISSDDLIYTVDFDYLDKGIRIRGQWYPILKMEWVIGRTLENYVSQFYADTMRMHQLARQFKYMAEMLKTAGIAHGDLQHGNILVSDRDLRLVDYDGMYVPALHSMQSNELGHAHYQHPLRNKKHFGAYLDNFSVWSIYTSLLSISIDPALWIHLNGGDDCLLFRHRDYLDPAHSHAFELLGRHHSPKVRHLTSAVRHLLKYQPENIPLFNLPEPDEDFGETVTMSNLPDWLPPS